MTKLTATLKQMLNALACADAGEFLTPGQKTDCLNRALGIAPETPAADVAATVAAQKGAEPAVACRRVALYMGSELPAEMLTYVAQTCARLKHGLTVLTFQSESAGYSLLAPYREMLKESGIDLRLESLTGDPVPGLAKYLRSHPEIAFLACKETGYLGRSFLNGTQRKNALPVPVVLVETHQEAAAHRPPQSSQQDSGRSSVA